MTREELLKEAIRRFRVIADDARLITLGNISHSTPKQIERYAVNSFELLETHICDEGNFICVKDRLPELRESVLVFGVLDANIPIFNSDGERIYHSDKVFDVWFNKRTEPSEHTDGNGFLLLKFHEEYKITHWFPLPKLDGKELYERI